MPLEDITLSDVSITMSPQASAGAPDMADAIPVVQRAGFVVRNARDVRLQNVTITHPSGPAFALSDVATWNWIPARRDSPSQARRRSGSRMLMARSFVRARLHQARRYFCRWKGRRRAVCFLTGNDLRGALAPVQRGEGVPAEAYALHNHGARK